MKQRLCVAARVSEPIVLVTPVAASVSEPGSPVRRSRTGYSQPRVGTGVRRRSFVSVCAFASTLLLLAALLLLPAPVCAETFDAKKATFMQLFDESLRPDDSARSIASRNAAYAELMARGPETLSNLLDRIHVENVMVGVYALNLTKDKPLPKEQAVPVLVSFLGAERPVTRKMAAFMLGFYRAPECAEQVFPLLDHEKTRGAAVRALGKWQATNALPRIEEVLRNAKERSRVMAANALRDIGDPRAIPALIAALDDPVFTVRNTAARALVAFGPAAVPPVLAALETATGEAKRRQLIRVLGDAKDLRAAGALGRMAKAGEVETRADAQRSLDLISGARSEPWFGPGGD